MLNSAEFIYSPKALKIPAISHLAEAVLTSTELLALLQLHALQELSQHARVLQFRVLLGQGTQDTLVSTNTSKITFNRYSRFTGPYPHTPQQNRIMETAGTLLDDSFYS